MPGKAARVEISERQQAALLQMFRSTTVAFRLRQRAQVILLAFETRLNRDIAEEVIKRGIVSYISKSHMNTLRMKAQLQPHKSRYWITCAEQFGPTSHPSWIGGSTSGSLSDPS